MVADKGSQSSFVSKEKILESIQALKDFLKKSEENAKTKKLFGNETEKLLLQVEFKKIPINRTTFIHCIKIPFHWRHHCDFEACLFVNDVNKQPLSDREADLELSKEHYKTILQGKEADHLINEILTMRELQTEFNVHEAKNKLASSFDIFLTDKKLMNNKFKFLSRFLGKQFWVAHKKVPSLLDLGSNDLKQQIENKLDETHMYVSGTGNSSSIAFGVLKQSNEELSGNLIAILNRINELFGINVRSLRIKTTNSMAITFYLDCGFITDVQINYLFKKREPIIDEFFDSNIAVYSDGTVQLMDDADGNAGKRKQPQSRQRKKRKIVQNIKN